MFFYDGFKIGVTHYFFSQVFDYLTNIGELDLLIGKNS